MLELKNISFQRDHKKILDQINLTFDENAFYVITGANGSGKSTLAKIIMGLIKMSCLMRPKLRLNKSTMFIFLVQEPFAKPKDLRLLTKSVWCCHQTKYCIMTGRQIVALAHKRAVLLGGCPVVIIGIS